MNNKMMQGRLLVMLSDGVAVRVLGVSEVRPEPTSSVVVVASRQMPWGWLELGPRRTLEDPEEGRRVATRTNKEHTTVYPGSGPSLGGKTPTPACLLSIYVSVSQGSYNGAS